MLISCWKEIICIQIFTWSARTMYDRAVEREPLSLGYVPDQYKTQEMCERAFKRVSYVSEWFWISMRSIEALSWSFALCKYSRLSKLWIPDIAIILILRDVILFYITNFRYSKLPVLRTRFPLPPTQNTSVTQSTKYHRKQIKNLKYRSSNCLQSNVRPQ